MQGQQSYFLCREEGDKSPKNCFASSLFLLNKKKKDLLGSTSGAKERRLYDYDYFG